MESPTVMSQSSERSSGKLVARPADRRFHVIGLVGGVASGKSFVADELARLGAVVLDADRAGHEVLRMPEVIAAARARWGDGVVDSSGQVNRQALAKIVFAPSEHGAAELAYLEQLTHPRIGDLLAERARAAAAGVASAMVLDAPVMLKAGWDDLCDIIVYVDAPREVRLARAKSRGWTEEEFNRREAAQETVDVKRARADVIIDNSTSTDSTRAQISRFWEQLGT